MKITEDIFFFTEPWYKAAISDSDKILHKNENWARVTFFRGKQKLGKEELL